INTMALMWMLILHLYMIRSAQTVDLSEASFVSAESGEPLTLHCKFVEKFSQNNWVWYKQRSGQEPQEVAVKLPTRDPTLSSDSKIRFKINQHFSLTIEQTTKDDEGMYFCGKGDEKTITFSNGTFLAVRGNKMTVLYIIFVSHIHSFSPGESVTLQCTVLSEIRAADLRVLWFRAAAGQSFPEIIYTHQNSSSRQCEISSSTSCSLYEFSKNILDQHHTGTYYCAVAACGKIIVGNGTSVELNPVMLTLAVFSAVCVAVIYLSVKKKVFLYFSVDDDVYFSQEQNTENLHYAAIHIKEKKAKGGRVKREQPEDVIYSHVRSSKAAAQRSHR
uniref:Ig-like domain-containing protein n=1 Tax=Pygocentrus nattereri TaxID=42514 RepID=A0A3B4EBG2_PYGNA